MSTNQKCQLKPGIIRYIVIWLTLTIAYMSWNLSSSASSSCRFLLIFLKFIFSFYLYFVAFFFLIAFFFSLSFALISPLRAMSSNSLFISFAAILGHVISNWVASFSVSIKRSGNLCQPLPRKLEARILNPQGVQYDI